MCQAYDADPKFRGGSNSALFTESELEKVAATDQKAERHWSSPTLILPTLEELCNQYRDAAEVELASADPTSTWVPDVAEPASAKEQTLVDGPPSVAEGVLGPLM